MIGTLKALITTLKTTLRRPVTVQYPQEHLPLQPRYMGFPGLIWDEKVGESACTGCQACARICPTECITVTMKDNPLFKEGKSPRRKIVDHYDLDIANCIVCGLCVEVCNFDAIVMTDTHEKGAPVRGKLLIDIKTLHEWGTNYVERMRAKGIEPTTGAPPWERPGYKPPQAATASPAPEAPKAKVPEPAGTTPGEGKGGA
ncbi:MAG: 4Fe-4S dicluster domain-containing protein [Chloroflexi bacterium]|nr:4Fe-4S dicluster domain-containing protein [Chloroflexota bacterium]